MKAQAYFSFAILAVLAFPVFVDAGTGPLPATVLRTDSTAFARGARVRLTLAGSESREVGTVRAVTPTAILLVTDDSGEYRSIPWKWVAGVERSSHRHRRTVLGLVVGTLAGCAIGSVAASGTSSEGSGFGPPTGFFTFLGSVGGGMLLGGIVGASIQSDEWEPVAQPIKPLPAKNPAEIESALEGAAEGS
ncbi:MAG TPA: hypothetical protein VFT93_02095 [Candidatus Eisenbacteria bacterium]|jgi:hypothetical protein|nr:hypothetical protein [Candidatus Eisenbacteria bacterium]